jgi:hypothetical protein
MPNVLDEIPTKRKSISRGRKIETRHTVIDAKDALDHLRRSATNGGWPQIRLAVNQALGGKELGADKAIVLDVEIDGELPATKEVKAIEITINKMLEEELNSGYRIKYAAVVNKFVLISKDKLLMLGIGSRKRRKGGK